jgi:MFS family permease
LFVASCATAFLGLYVPFFYAQLFATAAPDPSARSMAPYLVTVLNAGSVAGRILPTAAADSVGSLNSILVCIASCAVLAAAWLGIGNGPGLVVFSLLYGAFSGGVVSLSPTVIVTLSPSMAGVGGRMGICFLMAGLAVLIGTPIAGAVLGGVEAPRWQAMIGYGAASLILSTILIFIARWVVWVKKRAWRA